MSTNTRRVARAATIVMAAFIASRVLGLVREVVIARQFGTSVELAAYLAAFRVPDIIFQLVAGGALGSAFIPTFTQYLTQSQEDDAWQTASGIFNIAAAVLGACSLGATLIAPQLSSLIVPGFEPEMQALTAELMRVMLISPVIFGLSGIFMSVLNAHQHFLMPALAPVMYNLSIIGGAILLAPSMGVHGLALGVVIGSALHLLIQVPALLRRYPRYAPTLALHHPGVREVGRLMVPRAVGLVAVQANFLVNTILASGLGGNALPALNYAWLLMLLPQGVFALAIATAVFPTFSELAAANETAEFRSTLVGTLRVVFYLTIPAGAGLLMLRTSVIQLLLQRGRFTTASTDTVAWALQFYALGLFAHAGVEIMARAFYALHDTRTPVAVSVATMGLNILLSLLLMQPLAHGGLALANSIAVVLEMGVLMFLLSRQLNGLDTKRLTGSLVRVILATGTMAFGLLAILQRVEFPNSLFRVAAAIGMGATIYFATSTLLGSEEITAVRRLLRRAPATVVAPGEAE